MAKPVNKLKSKKIKIGILGGSFDPAHKGHLIISKIALKKFKLDKIYWLITKKNPFKNKTHFSLEERIKLAKKATQNLKKVQVLYLDNVVKSSRSINLVNYLIKKKKLTIFISLLDQIFCLNYISGKAGKN